MIYKELKRYDSYIPKDSYLHWNKDYALKELIKQVIDCDGSVTINDSSCLVLEFPNAIYPPYMLMNGLGNNYRENPFAVMNAGMKVAIYTLLRDNIRFYFMNNLGSFTGLDFMFEFKESDELNIETMHVYVRHRYELHVRGTRIEIPNITIDELERIKTVELTNIMKKDIEKLSLESKLLMFKYGMSKIKVSMDKEIDKLLLELNTNEMKLYCAIFYDVKEWSQKGGAIAFIKEYLKEKQIDLRKIAKEKNILTKELDCLLCSYFD